MSRAVATLFGVGHLRPGPGSWGSAVAVAAAWPLHALGGFPGFAAATLAVFLLGWWATEAATRGQADHDPGEIVIDEVAGQWVALWPVSAGLWAAGADPWTFPWPGWVSAFLLFRLFDIYKPGPVGWADRRGDALGTMLDDILAGLMAAVGVGLLAWLFHAVFVF